MFPIVSSFLFRHPMFLKTIEFPKCKVNKKLGITSYNIDFECVLSKPLFKKNL